VSPLARSDLAADPVAQFRNWLDAARQAGLEEPDAMTLATATPAGRPSARVVMLKHFDAEGFVFSTNYRSRKGGELETNPFAALLFHWPPQNRQVRIEGRTQPAPQEESDRIFANRPRPARISAWASPQSSVIPDRRTLEAHVVREERRHAGEVPRPEHWGGYRLVPESFEFWQGHESRLHDRLRFRRDDQGIWCVDRLAP
jgi:pyridoxamine 5'-phosphate oxidase